MAARHAMPMVLVLLAALSPGCVDAYPSGPTWSEHLQAIDEALARNDVGAALHAWHARYTAALRSGTWIALVEFGDAYLRIPTAGQDASLPKPVARQAYLRALVRAEAQGSAQGALAVALAFDDLGDTQVAAYCMRVAERLAQRKADAVVLEQVMLERERLGGRLAARPERLR
jgi:hypothetical protein